MNEIPEDIFNNVTVFVKVGDYLLIPLRIQIGRKDIMIQVEANKGEMGEEEGLKLIEIICNIFNERLNAESSPDFFMRDFEGKELIDAVRIHLI